MLELLPPTAAGGRPTRSGGSQKLMATSQGHPSKPCKSVGQEFVDHRLLSRIGHYPDSKYLPRQLDMVAYFKDEPPCQTTHCTNVAVEQYNAHQQSDDKKIMRAVGVDSNMFILDQNDPLSYWHVYFKGYVGTNRYRCFAELSGEKGPELLRYCSSVNKASVVVCKNCFGGIYHPPGVDFKGSPSV
ncbi:hypothetical protein ZWY2020_051261 [Hordeum vulgare]|nr:hypothetical protein ZWY2020_051261 [Hordeum vulgare]